jgi:hypothetical protein
MSIDAIPAELSSRFDKLLARYDEWWAQADEATERYDEVNKINNVVPKTYVRRRKFRKNPTRKKA